MLTRLPMKFLSTLINAQILRDGLTHSQNGSHFLVIRLTRAMVKDAKNANITAGRSGKASHTSQPTISSSMKRTCNTCAVFVVSIRFGPEKREG